VSTVLSDFAAQVERELEHHGWCERGAYSPDGRICLTVAMGRVLTRVSALHMIAGLPPGWQYPGWWQVQNIASDVAVSLFPGRGGQAYEVNDHPDTTREDISLILKHLQARLDEEVA
jgi:hypothetical protein